MWILVIEDRTGKLISQGTVVADPLPRGLHTKDILNSPDNDAQIWDEASETFVDRPAPTKQEREDLADSIGDDPELGSLNASTRTKLKNVVRRVLGSDVVRYNR